MDIHKWIRENSDVMTAVTDRMAKLVDIISSNDRSNDEIEKLIGSEAFNNFFNLSDLIEDTPTLLSAIDLLGGERQVKRFEQWRAIFLHGVKSLTKSLGEVTSDLGPEFKSEMADLGIAVDALIKAWPDVRSVDEIRSELLGESVKTVAAPVDIGKVYLN